MCGLWTINNLWLLDRCGPRRLANGQLPFKSRRTQNDRLQTVASIPTDTTVPVATHWPPATPGHHPLPPLLHISPAQATSGQSSPPPPPPPSEVGFRRGSSPTRTPPPSRIRDLGVRVSRSLSACSVLLFGCDAFGEAWEVELLWLCVELMRWERTSLCWIWRSVVGVVGRVGVLLRFEWGKVCSWEREVVAYFAFGKNLGSFFFFFLAFWFWKVSSCFGFGCFGVWRRVWSVWTVIVMMVLLSVFGFSWHCSSYGRIWVECMPCDNFNLDLWDLNCYFRSHWRSRIECIFMQWTDLFLSGNVVSAQLLQFYYLL